MEAVPPLSGKWDSFAREQDQGKTWSKSVTDLTVWDWTLDTWERNPMNSKTCPQQYACSSQPPIVSSPGVHMLQTLQQKRKLKLLLFLDSSLYHLKLSGKFGLRNEAPNNFLTMSNPELNWTKQISNFWRSSYTHILHNSTEFSGPSERCFYL